MTHVFITGCPGAGKSTLARRLAEETGAKHIYLDGLKKILRKNPELKPWVDFYGRQNEEAYWEAHDHEAHFAHVVLQSEALWPRMRRVIQQFQQEHSDLIIDGANALPHLVKRDLDITGIVLLPPSEEEFARRLREEPRWSEDPALQRLEARRYLEESAWYAKAAKAHGYEVFEDPEAAFFHLRSILMKKKHAVL